MSVASKHITPQKVRLHAGIVDHAVRASSRSCLSTRSDYTFSKHEREGRPRGGRIAHATTGRRRLPIAVAAAAESKRKRCHSFRQMRTRSSLPFIVHVVSAAQHAALLAALAGNHRLRRRSVLATMHNYVCDLAPLALQATDE